MANTSLKKLARFLTQIEDEGDFMILHDDEMEEMDSCYDCGFEHLVDRVTRLHLDNGEEIVVHGKGCPSCHRLFIPFWGIMEAIIAGLSDDVLDTIEQTDSYLDETIDLITPIDEQMTIGVEKNVFIVKKYTFSCDKAGHEIENIDARIALIDQWTGKLIVMTVPAGYCRQCGEYFIFMNTYESLLRVGIPVCSIIDPDKDLEEPVGTGKRDYSNYKTESILRQHGYSVSAQEGLSAKARQRILGLLMDYDICSKTRIESYLSFFIDQRRRRPNMEAAISKWKEDLAFVDTYRIGATKEVWVDELRNLHHFGG